MKIREACQMQSVHVPADRLTRMTVDEFDDLRRLARNARKRARQVIRAAGGVA
jgi:hypothetical protein